MLLKKDIILFQASNASSSLEREREQRSKQNKARTFNSYTTVHSDETEQYKLLKQEVTQEPQGHEDEPRQG